MLVGGCRHHGCLGPGFSALYSCAQPTRKDAKPVNLQPTILCMHVMLCPHAQAGQTTLKTRGTAWMPAPSRHACMLGLRQLDAALITLIIIILPIEWVI